MTAQYDRVLRAALQLSDDERARLADILLETLEPATESGVDEAWTAEIERRSDEFDAGKVAPILWNKVRESAREQC